MNRLVVLTCIVLFFFNCKNKKELSESSGDISTIQVFCNAEYKPEIELKLNQLLGVDSILIDENNLNNNKLEKNYNAEFPDFSDENFDCFNQKIIVIFNINNKQDKLFQSVEKAGKLIKKRGRMAIFTDVWAKNQLVLCIESGSVAGLFNATKTEEIEFINELESFIKNNYNKLTINKKYSDSILNLIKQQYQFQFALGEDYKLVQADKNLLWFYALNNELHKSIFINIFSDSVEVKTMKQAIENRNYFTKKYIKNKENTNVVVSESSIFPKQWIPKSVNGSALLRGWYTEEGTYRRGVFERYFFHDKNNKRYIVFDFFMHKPENKKITQVHAFNIIAQSVQF